jgi:hypothetical protein
MRHYAMLGFALASAMALAVATAGGAPPLGGALQPNDIWLRMTSGDAVFEAPRYGGQARLFVHGSDGWRVHRGADLDGILALQPLLREHPDVASLETALAETKTALDASATPLPAWRAYVRAPGLSLEQSSLDTNVRLYVMEGTTERVHVGTDLAAIAAARPELRELPGYEALDARAGAPRAFGRSPAPGASGELEVWFEPEEVVVRAWRFAEGVWRSSTFRGPSLRQIMEQGGDARDALSGWIPSEEDMPATSPLGRAETEVSGATLAPHEAVVDGTMRRCLRVTRVQPGSRAERIGIREKDILLSVNGRTLTSPEAARMQMDATSSTTIVVIRDGQRTTLTDR